MARRRQAFGRGLPKLALSLFVTLAMVLGMCPTAGIAEEVAMEPEGEPVVEVKTKGNEEPLLQAQGSACGLWVGGVQVTSANAADVLGTTDGEAATVKFAPATAGNNPTPATLTLDGANITTGYVISGDSTSAYGIYYTGTDPLKVVVASDSRVEINEGKNVTAGIWCSDNADLTITGPGKLTVKDKDHDTSAGISGGRDVTIDNGVVDASGGSFGIFARSGNVVVTNGSTVEATATDGPGIECDAVTVSGGTVKASGTTYGIYGESVTISGGEVTATASDGGGDGIHAYSTPDKPDSVTISGGTVSATGGAEGYGIYAKKKNSGEEAPSTVTIGGGIDSVTASGGMQAIEGAVTNGVAGMGWTNAAGTTGKAAIATSTEARTLDYKKAQFPTPVAKVTKAPEPTNPTYNGKAQALVTAGTAEGGAMQYSLDNEAWSDKVPTATEPGTYTVWYKVVGDTQHANSETQKVTSTIVKGVIVPTIRGHVQNVGDVAGRASGVGVAVGTEGRGLRLEQFSLALPKDTDGGIEYRGHIQNKGWGGWAADGKECGTRGSGLRLEALQVRLTGKVKDTHSVWYRAHAQNLGTLGWSHDGQAAGTAGRGLRVEDLEVCVLPKGEVPESGAGSQASFVGAVGGSAHSQNVGWAPSSSSLAFGTTGRGLRLEALRLSAPALPEACGISYQAHVQNVGWQGARTAGGVAGTTGRGLRTEAVRISLTGAASGSYSVWYRVHSQNLGWLGWAKDGTDAGTVGRGLRAEAVQVQVLPQDQVPAGYDASKAACIAR